MQVSGAEQQRQNSVDGLFPLKPELPQETKGDEGGKHVEQNVRAVANHDAAHRRIVLVSGEDVPACNPGPDHIRGQHQQRLADSVPAENLSAAAVQPELGIFVGEDLRLGSPQPVRGLQAVHRVGGAQFSRLHHEGEERRGQSQQK